MILLSRRLVLFFVAAAPYVVLPRVLAWSVEPLARTGARWCNVLVPDLSFASSRRVFSESRDDAAVPSETDGQDIVGEAEDERRGAPAPSRAIGKRGSDGAASGSRLLATARRVRTHLFVGRESILRAIPEAGRPTSSWTQRTQQHPAGLLIQSPGALSGVIEPGDILVEAEGKPLGSFEQLVTTVKQAYERRAAHLSGRVFRKGDLVWLTVEPGW